MDGDTLKGNYTGSSGETEIKDLSFEDDTLKFTVDVGMVIYFSATIDGENLEGMLPMEYGEADIIGKKRKWGNGFFRCQLQSQRNTSNC